MADEQGESAPGTDLTGRRGALVGGLWNAAQMVLPLLGTTLLSIVLGRVLGPELLGEQSLISYSEALLAGLLVMSLQTASLQLMSASLGAGQRQRADTVARWAMGGQLVNGLISATVLIGVGWNSGYRWAWVVAGFTALVNAIGWGYATRVIAHTGSWTAVASRRLWTQLLSQVAAAVAVLMGAGLTAVFAANLVGAVLLLGLLQPMAERLGPRLHGISREIIRLWTLFIVRAALVQVVAQRIEFLFLAAYSTPDAIAMYSIPFMVVSAVVLIPTSVIAAGMPAMAAREGAGQGEQLAGHLGLAVRVTLLASIPLAFGLLALGPRLVTVLYGQTYLEAGTLLAWMAPLVLVLPAAAVCETYWYGIAALRRPLTIASIAAVIDLLLCFLLIPRFDALGAAWANLGGQGVGAILMLTATARALRTIRLPLGRMVISGVAMGLLAGATWGATQWHGGLEGLLAGMAVAIVGGLLFGRFVGYLGREEAEWLQHALPSRLAFAMPFLAGGRR